MGRGGGSWSVVSTKASLQTQCPLYRQPAEIPSLPSALTEGCSLTGSCVVGEFAAVCGVLFPPILPLSLQLLRQVLATAFQ